MSTQPTRADIDRLNQRTKELLTEGFPSSEAVGQAFEEFRGSQRDDGLHDSLKLTLLRAPDDEAHESPAFQEEIREFESALKEHGVQSSARWLTQDSEHGWCGYVGVIAIAIPTIIPAVRAVIIAYMKRRTGRKVQIEFDGLKVKLEEPTTEEADRALKIIEQRHKEKRQKK